MICAPPVLRVLYLGVRPMTQASSELFLSLLMCLGEFQLHLGDGCTRVEVLQQCATKGRGRMLVHHDVLSYYTASFSPMCVCLKRTANRR